MTTKTDNDAERDVRLEQRLEQFQTAQRQQLVKRGIALWRRTEAQRAAARGCGFPSDDFGGRS